MGWGVTFIAVAGIGAWLVDAFNSFTDSKYPKLSWIIYCIIILPLAIYIYFKKIKLERQCKDLNIDQGTPQVVLLSSPGQLRLNNNGDKDIYLLGTKFADTEADYVDEERIIAPSHHYYFLTDKLEDRAKEKLGINGSELVPFIVYIKDHLGKEYNAKFKLLIKVNNGLIEIHTQQLGLQKINSTSNFNGS